MHYVVLEKGRAARNKTPPTNIGEIKPFGRNDNWASFFERLEAYIALNNVSHGKKTALLLTKLSHEVVQEVKAACRVHSLLTMPYDALIMKLKEVYEPSSNRCLQRLAFRDRKQMTGESVKDYVFALRCLSQQCKFHAGEIDDRIKDQLISGVNPRSMRYELLKASGQPLCKVIELAKTIEMANNGAYGAPNSKATKKTNSPTQMKPQSSTPAKTKSFDGRQQTSKHCFCCGQSNHTKAQCFLRDKFCSECGKKGHVSKMCLTRRNRNTEIDVRVKIRGTSRSGA